MTVRERLNRWVSNNFGAFQEINRKYAEPRLKKTKGVRLALLILKLYLVFLVIILFAALVNLAVI